MRSCILSCLGADLISSARAQAGSQKTAQIHRQAYLAFFL
jgi:hypothetical protein